jgi:hypothetical protein
MNKGDDSVDKTALPGERGQPLQPIQRANDPEHATLSGPSSGEFVDREKPEHQRAGAKSRTSILDHARFTVGVVNLYEAVLSEPIPESMLRLIDEIGKQERKS